MTTCLEQEREQLAFHSRGVVLPYGPKALQQLPVLYAATLVERVHREERAVSPDVDENNERRMGNAAVRDVALCTELHQLLPEENEEDAGVRGMSRVSVGSPGNERVIVLDRYFVGEKGTERAV